MPAPPPLWRRPSWWFAAAATTAVAAACWWAARPALLSHWQGHYGNWRDLYLAVRVVQAPAFLATLAALALAVALLLRPAERLDNYLASRRGGGDAGSQPLLWGLLAVAVIVGLPLSLAEWQRYGLPCWDGYCERAALWAAWFAEPSQQGLIDLFRVTSSFYTGDSLIPPIVIGAGAALGLSLTLAFMLVDLLSWIAVAALTVRVGRRLGLDRRGTAAALLLLFAHLAVLRSLIFPQTDPIGLAFMMLALDATLALAERRSPRRAGWLFVTLVVGLASKLSFAPMLAVPPLAALLTTPGGRRRRLRRAWLDGLAFSLAPAAVWVGFLAATGLLPALFSALGFVAGRDDPSANFYADNNPLRFLIVLALTVQLFPLLLAGEWKRIAGDPRRRLLAAVVVLFAVALVALRAAFWPRYFLPLLPPLALLAAPPLVAGSSGPYGRALLAAAYLAANAAFLAFGLYY